MNALIKAVVGNINESVDRYNLQPITEPAQMAQTSKDFKWCIHDPSMWRKYSETGRFYILNKGGRPLLGIWISNDGQRSEVHGDLSGAPDRAARN